MDNIRWLKKQEKPASGMTLTRVFCDDCGTGLEYWLSKEQAKVLVQSSDGSERGKSKLSTPYGGRFIGWLRSDELGMAFGRQTVIHCALASSGITQRVVEEAHRLKGLRITEGAKSPLQKEKTAR